MTQEHIISLIHAQLSGQISTEQATELRLLRNGDPEVELLYSEIRSAWEQAQLYNTDIKVDTDKAADKFMQQIENSSPAVPQLEAKKTATQFSLYSLSAGIAALLLIVAGIFLISKMSSTEDMTRVVAQKDAMIHLLNDGTSVTLKKGSVLAYQSDFDIRTLELQGEAFFDVARDESRPFTIHTPLTTIQVLGTSFNVKEETTQTALTVFSGKVSFAAKDKNQSSKVILEKNEAATYHAATGKMLAKREVASNSIHWFRNELHFQDEKIEQLLPILSQFYDTSLVVDNPSILNCTLTGNFKRNQLQEAIETLEFSLNLNAQKGENGIQFSGQGCQ